MQPSRPDPRARDTLAIVPDAGDGILHHLDRIGNVNVFSNLTTGAYIGHDEYTPFGRLSVSMVIEPQFAFQGARFDPHLELVLLGARHYYPALGRFLTPDRYVARNQSEISGLLSGLNLYLDAAGNPINFIDPSDSTMSSSPPSRSR
jgi:RHS repeat-associated protein